jgi:hypothetical protein
LEVPGVPAPAPLDVVPTLLAPSLHAKPRIVIAEASNKT